MDSDGCLSGCYLLIGGVIFFGVWIYSATAYGFLGFALGWMPALILAAIWPLIFVLAILAAIVIGAILGYLHLTK